MRMTFCSIILVCFATAPSARAIAEDAWPLYDKAIQQIEAGYKAGIACPAASNDTSPQFSDGWKKRSKEAYDYNATALKAVHEAAQLDHATWPVEGTGKDIQLKYLSGTRAIANQVGDAALWEHNQGNDLAALDRLNDLLHLAELLDQPKDELLVQFLVSIGIQSLTLDRLEIIAADIHLSGVPKNDGGKTVPVAMAEAWIKRLFTNDVDVSRIDRVIANDLALAGDAALQKESREKARTTAHRLQMERNLAAMSLACQIVKFEKGRWPHSVAEIVALLPEAPRDHWGEMGYVVVKRDGVERPMVYSRCNAEGLKLAYPIYEPQFGYYNSASLGLPQETPIPGQFRDITYWDAIGPVQMKDLN